MSKHQTLSYIKYGKLINKINDEIIDQTIKDDMFNFLANFPLLLKYPNLIDQFNYCRRFNNNNRPTNIDIVGRLLYAYPTKKMSTHLIDINFDGKNKFKLYLFSKKYPWILINNVNHYIDNHLDIFKNIIN